MAASKPRKSAARKSQDTGLESDTDPDPGGHLPGETDEFGIETTGRLIATFLDTSKSGVESAMKAIKNQSGISSLSQASDYALEDFSVEDAVSDGGLVFDELNIAVLSGDPDQMSAMAAFTASSTENMIVEPEFVNFALDEDLDDDLPAGGGDDDGGDDGPLPVTGGGGFSQGYLRGFRDAADQLARVLSEEADVSAGAGADTAAFGTPSGGFPDTASSTWGLKATDVLRARTTGRGIKVAVLDTGFDLRHPDFAGRAVTSRSFIAGESVQDRNGHGTHCIGTACGPARPGLGPRYGVASEAEIFAGKVLSNAGRGGDSSILAGINWALQNKCEIVSMSLGRRVRLGEAPQTNYQVAGRRALAAGTLIVAAAGNDSARPNVVIPVSSPANASSIAAIAALDRRLRVADFSNRGINPGGGEINLAGPGVQVLSSWPMPVRLRIISGTSMATPHVAGVAALVAEESRRFRGLRLYRELRRRARRLPLPRADVGNGLVRA